VIARTGNLNFLEFLVKPCIKFENYGFNQLHHDVLVKKTITDKLLSASVTKKCFSNKNVTPLHFAAINPNQDVIEKLLAQNPEINVTDEDLWKPIHYASACTGSGPLKVLLKHGANLNDLTN
jgi:ankyrin repeat protein